MKWSYNIARHAGISTGYRGGDPSVGTGLSHESGGGSENSEGDPGETNIRFSVDRRVC